MTISESQAWTDQERVELQRKCVAEHIGLENAHAAIDQVLKETFAQEGAFYDVVPGMAHFEGLEGVAGFYEMLFSVLPDIHISVNHQYDVPGCCVLEGFVTGTHSSEFAGIPASGNRIGFAFCAMYLFRDDPTKLVAERAYWDNQGLMSQMTGESPALENTPWDDTL
jgi:predicted ester cyclase